jgi:hypothetical protein
MDEVFRWNDWNEDHVTTHGVLPEEACPFLIVDDKIQGIAR